MAKKDETVDVVVEVTQEDIDGSVYGSIHNCPLARAGRRVLGGSCWVGAEKIHWAGVYCAPLPSNALSARRVVDEAGQRAIKPFSFTLSFPQALVSRASDKAGRDEGSKTNATH